MLAYCQLNPLEKKLWKMYTNAHLLVWRLPLPKWYSVDICPQFVYFFFLLFHVLSIRFHVIAYRRREISQLSGTIRMKLLTLMKIIIILTHPLLPHTNNPHHHICCSLTQWGQVTHICFSTTYQQCFRYFSEILFQIWKFSFKEMYLKITSVKMAAILSRPQCANPVGANDMYMRQ